MTLPFHCRPIANFNQRAAERMNKLEEPQQLASMSIRNCVASEMKAELHNLQQQLAQFQANIKSECLILITMLRNNSDVDRIHQSSVDIDAIVSESRFGYAANTPIATGNTNSMLPLANLDVDIDVVYQDSDLEKFKNESVVVDEFVTNLDQELDQRSVVDFNDESTVSVDLKDAASLSSGAASEEFPESVLDHDQNVANLEIDVDMVSRDFDPALFKEDELTVAVDKSATELDQEPVTKASSAIAELIHEAKIITESDSRFDFVVNYDDDPTVDDEQIRDATHCFMLHLTAERMNSEQEITDLEISSENRSFILLPMTGIRQLKDGKIVYDRVIGNSVQIGTNRPYASESVPHEAGTINEHGIIIGTTILDHPHAYLLRTSVLIDKMQLSILENIIDAFKIRFDTQRLFSGREERRVFDIVHPWNFIYNDALTDDPSLFRLLFMDQHRDNSTSWLIISYYVQLEIGWLHHVTEKSKHIVTDPNSMINAAANSDSVREVNDQLMQLVAELNCKTPFGEAVITDCRVEVADRFLGQAVERNSQQQGAAAVAPILVKKQLCMVIVATRQLIAEPLVELTQSNDPKAQSTIVASNHHREIRPLLFFVHPNNICYSYLLHSTNVVRESSETAFDNDKRGDEQDTYIDLAEFGQIHDTQNIYSPFDPHFLPDVGALVIDSRKGSCEMVKITDGLTTWQIVKDHLHHMDFIKTAFAILPFVLQHYTTMLILMLLPYYMMHLRYMMNGAANFSMKKWPERRNTGKQIGGRHALHDDPYIFRLLLMGQHKLLLRNEYTVVDAGERAVGVWIGLRGRSPNLHLSHFFVHTGRLVIIQRAINIKDEPPPCLPIHHHICSLRTRSLSKGRQLMYEKPLRLWKPLKGPRRVKGGKASRMP